MKKLFGIISATVILASAMVFSGCSAEDEEVLAPTETWVEKTYNYTSTGSDGKTTTSQLTCYFMFTEKGYANSNLKNVPEASQYGSAKTIKPGLTVVAIPATDSTLATTFSSAITSGKEPFVCKTFPLGTLTETDSSDNTSFSFEMTKAKWNVFYYANIASFMKNDQLKNPPVPLKTDGYDQPDLTSDNIKKNFSWKKLLANYLLGTL